MTSAKQGPWTDIYGLSATLYHAIAGQTPPSAFRTACSTTPTKPLGKKDAVRFCPRPAWPALMPELAGARPATGPQSIGGWRPILGSVSRHSRATRRSCSSAPPEAPSPAVVEPIAGGRPADGEKSAVWAFGSGRRRGDRGAGRRLLRPGRRQALRRLPRSQLLSAPSGRRQRRHRIAQLAAESAAPEGPGGACQAAHQGCGARESRGRKEAAQRKQIEEETRHKIEAEMADKQRQQDEARQKAEADAGGQAQGRKKADEEKGQKPRPAARGRTGADCRRPAAAPAAHRGQPSVASSAPRSGARTAPGTGPCIARRRGTAARSPFPLSINVLGRYRHLDSSRFRTRDDGQTSLSRFRINGQQVSVARVFVPQQSAGPDADRDHAPHDMTAPTTITGFRPRGERRVAGPCQISLSRQ